MLKLLVASLSLTAAFKVESTSISAAKPVVPLLKLRGGVDQTQLAKYAVYFVSGFMFIPAGRDVISPGAEVMPDDDKMLAKMFDDKTKDGYQFMWNAWGVNWIMLSIMKIMAVTSGNADFIKLGLAADALAVGMMLKGWIPEFKPFLAMFGLETLALAKLAFA
jgi:hypothetical protein